MLPHCSRAILGRLSFSFTTYSPEFDVAAGFVSFATVSFGSGLVLFEVAAVCTGMLYVSPILILFGFSASFGLALRIASRFALVFAPIALPAILLKVSPASAV